MAQGEIGGPRGYRIQRAYSDIGSSLDRNTVDKIGIQRTPCDLDVCIGEAVDQPSWQALVSLNSSAVRM